MVTGYCYSCSNMEEAAALSHSLSVLCALSGDVLKVGKNAGQWYCVLVLNTQGA